MLVLSSCRDIRMDDGNMKGTRSSVRNPSSFSRIIYTSRLSGTLWSFLLYTHIYLLQSVTVREEKKRRKLCFLHKHALKSRRSTIALTCFPGSGVGSLAQLHFLEFRDKWFKSVYATDTLFLDDRFLCLFSLIEINIYIYIYLTLYVLKGNILGRSDGRINWEVWPSL